MLSFARSFSCLVGLSALAVACSSDPDPAGFGSGTGGGGSTGTSTTPMSSGGASVMLPPPGGGASSTGAGGSGDCNPQVIGLLRDFTPKTHPDFEYMFGDDPGIVQEGLDPTTRKPIWAGGTHTTVHTQADFDEWYRDTPGVNMTFQYELPLTTAASGNAVFDSAAFFPLDGQGYGNEGRDNRGKLHNFHFTFELHMTFHYAGSEVFTFIGDDDVFVFINNHLAIDLGGVHNAETATVTLAQKEAQFGITPGGDYPIDFFQAERHTTESHFHMETNLGFTNCTPIIVR